MKKLIIIQARTTSKRFPGKVLEVVGGKRLIDYAIDAAKQTGYPYIVAIPRDNKKLQQYLKDNYINSFLGPENDVLDRFERVARTFEPKTIIRLCADTLYEKNDIFEIESLYEIRKRFTYGNGVYVMSRKELEDTWLNAKGKHREHVTTFLYRCVDDPGDVKRFS